MGACVSGWVHAFLDGCMRFWMDRRVPEGSGRGSGVHGFQGPWPPNTRMRAPHTHTPQGSSPAEAGLAAPPPPPAAVHTAQRAPQAPAMPALLPRNCRRRRRLPPPPPHALAVAVASSRSLRITAGFRSRSNRTRRGRGEGPVGQCGRAA
eukprot:350740-Chlamydomonas_euryale.AAC.1